MCNEQLFRYNINKMQGYPDYLGACNHVSFFAIALNMILVPSLPAPLRRFSLPSVLQTKGLPYAAESGHFTC